MPLILTKEKVVGNEYSSDFTIAGGADSDALPKGPLYNRLSK